MSSVTMLEQQHYCSIAHHVRYGYMARYSRTKQRKRDSQSIAGTDVNTRILCILQCMMLYVLATVHPGATATGDAQTGKRFMNAHV